MPRPHAVPVTRKTLSRAARTPGSRSSSRVGRRDAACGPAIAEKGSTRAIASRSRDGGTRSLIALRIFECCDVLAQLALAGQVQRDGAGDPDDGRAGGGAEHHARRPSRAPSAAGR